MIASSPPPTVPRAPVALGQPSHRPVPRDPDCRAAWTLVGVLLAFKVVTIGLVLAKATPVGPQLLLMLFAFNWIWLIPAALFLSVIPFAFWFRLVRARTRRRQRQRAEFYG